jgi:hypothetical protein
MSNCLTWLNWAASKQVGCVGCPLWRRGSPPPSRDGSKSCVDRGSGFALACTPDGKNVPGTIDCFAEDRFVTEAFTGHVPFVVSDAVRTVPLVLFAVVSLHCAHALT